MTEHVKEESELEKASKEMRDHLYIDSLWQTYQESVDLVVPDPANPEGPGSRITRKLSIGMSVKSDNRAPAKVLQFALSRALNGLMEEEKERWLEPKSMELEIQRVKYKLGDNNGKGRETNTTSSNEGVPIDLQGNGEVPNPDGSLF